MLPIFKKTLWDTRKSLAWLCLGLSIYVLVVMSVYPTLKEQSQEMNDLLQSYPDGMLSMIYGEMPEGELDIAEPGGYIHSQYALWMVLILGGMLINQTFNGITNAERDNSIDMLLSLPISRRDYLLGRILAALVYTLMVLTASALTFVVSTLIWPEFDVSIVDIALSMYGAVFIIMAVVSFTYLLAAFIPSSKRFAGPLAYLFLIGSYLVHGLAGLTEETANLRPYLIYDYYNAGTLIREGIDPMNWIVLSAIIIICFGLAYWQIERKELSV